MSDISIRLHLDAPIIIDGAMGTLLLDRGLNVSLPLWSAKTLEKSGKVVEEIHKDYINAGAEIITTNTFRTTTRTFLKVTQGNLDKAREYAWNNCKIAVKAAKKVAGKNIFVAGSIAPLEDCYIPELFPGEKSGFLEFRELGKWLVELGVDLFLIETMGNVAEAKCALRAVNKYPIAKWVSFIIKDPQTILDGTNLKEGSRIAESEGASVILINCSRLNDSIKALRILANTVSIPIGVYPNLGKTNPEPDGFIKELYSKEEFIKMMQEAIASGAKIVGACCGSTPQYIASLKDSIK